MDMQQNFGRSFKELFWENMDRQQPDLSSLMAFTAWEIWNAGNKLYFENKRIELFSVLQRAQNGYTEFALEWEKEKNLTTRSTPEKKWIKPTMGKLKCNCDVSIQENGKVGFGFVVRDHEGKVRLAGKEESRADGSTTLLEGLAMRYAIQMISQYHLSVDSVKSDTLSLVESILGNMQPEVYVDIVIQDI